MNSRPLRVGDMIELLAPGYGEPAGPCVVLADQSNGLVWFAAQSGGAAHVARRQAIRILKRIRPAKRVAPPGRTLQQ